jgi:T5SS/PEP-CTERM-associated repeat protein/autotransporter-associated beta strand protein
VSGGTWTVNNEFIVGNLGAGVLNLSGASTVNVADGIGNTTLGLIGGSSGIANVSGGTWTNNGVFIGSSGTGELNISGAGAVSSGGGFLGDEAGGSGTANVSGGTWTISGPLSVGGSGAGVLNLSGGAVSNSFATLGFNAGSTGAANVSGGTWTNSSNFLTVGNSGIGELTIAGTGMVSVGAGGGTVFVARFAGSTGTLNFGDGAGAPGTLLAAQVNGGAGTAKVNFNHTSTAYSFASQLTGSLAVEVLQGTTIFTAANTYTGGTKISGGTLTLENSTAAGTGAVEIDGGALDIADQSIGNTIAFGAAGGTIKSGGASGGTINSALSLTNTNQILSPGDSPGILAFGTSQSWDSGAYLWEVNDWSGTTAGAEFDQIQITGGLTLTGALPGSYILDITSLTAGNLPGDVSNFSDANQSWIILTTTSGILGFDPGFWTLDAASFDSSPDWTGEFSIIQAGNDLLLNYTVVPEPATGDFDLDGDVDGRDFLEWTAAFGETSDADADNDGDSDGADFLAWQQQFGSPPPPAAAVPEPLTSGILWTALAAIGCCGRRLCTERRSGR